ncbi:hypothetical protein U1Q18_036291 [Sarracenia purpurea var. burkii]
MKRKARGQAGGLGFCNTGALCTGGGGEQWRDGGGGDQAEQWRDGTEWRSAATRSGGAMERSGARAMVRISSAERWGDAGGDGDQAFCVGGIVCDARWRKPVVLLREHRGGAVTVMAKALCA